MLTFISIVDQNERRSTLACSSKDPSVLRVVGNLPHGSEIRPASPGDAALLQDWARGVDITRPIESVPVTGGNNALSWRQ